MTPNMPFKQRLSYTLGLAQRPSTSECGIDCESESQDGISICRCTVERLKEAQLLRSQFGGTTFTLEPNNLKNRPTYRGSGLIHKKTVGVIPAPDNKGVMLVMKRKKGQNRPAKMYNKVTFKKGWRSNLKGIANSVNGYRSDLKMAALRRASAIHMSQRGPASSRRSELHDPRPHRPVEVSLETV
ncbi:putative 60S ribosomal protein L28 [Apostichopus japonicus]|uniref:Large ribosomal subunit protein eL28 n=1 Tax=Stichopus japonicus TaxID=307972 RepID=A0A2G8LRP7_STIJA|nr:putative 60S ribosomal protein L28 [Apostichopus japonicus]